jgi:hypothetical protein
MAPGEGPFTIPFADLHQCKPVEFTAYALASRLKFNRRPMA